MKIKKTNILIALLCAISVWQFSSAAYIHVKAKLAQYLVEKAWLKSKQNNDRVAPWPWADTYPVAKLNVPKHGVEQMVLSGASGATMAFGPGWMKSSAKPGDEGVSIISAHRDTHFEFLQDLRLGDEITIESLSNKSSYQIIDMEVVDSRYQRLSMDSVGSSLVLITCYPFGGVLVGGPLRYVVTAEKNQKKFKF
jgi:sortase A